MSNQPRAQWVPEDHIRGPGDGRFVTARPSDKICANFEDIPRDESKPPIDQGGTIMRITIVDSTLEPFVLYLEARSMTAEDFCGLLSQEVASCPYGAAESIHMRFREEDGTYSPMITLRLAGIRMFNANLFYYLVNEVFSAVSRVQFEIAHHLVDGLEPADLRRDEEEVKALLGAHLLAISPFLSPAFRRLVMRFLTSEDGAQQLSALEWGAQIMPQTPPAAGPSHE